MRSIDMPLFGTGRVHNPYASDLPAAKRQRLKAVGDLATALGAPEVAGFLNEAADVVDLTGDQVNLLKGPPSSVRSGLRTKTMSRGRSRRSGRRKTFNARVGSALLKFAETKRLVDSVAESLISAGDGTTRTLYIANPIAQLGQGDEGRDISGDSFWIKACWLRGRLSLDQATNSLRVRMLLIKTRQFADLPAGFTVYGNTTTALTVPTQVAADGETNIRIFETSDAEETAQPSAPFVGNATGIDIIDSDLVKVVGGREYFLSTQHLLNFKNFSIYIPVNEKFKLYSEFGTTPTDQIRTVDGYNYYWIIQVFSNSNANNILVAQDCLITADIITYHKEI